MSSHQSEDELVSIEIEINEDLLQKVEALAFARNQSVNDFIVEALGAYIEKQKSSIG